MQVAFDAAQIELRVKKTKEDLGDLKEKNIKASIDLKDKKEGTYEVVDVYKRQYLWKTVSDHLFYRKNA